jgi:BirA family biotin operon repressor/biotin-[acetyl-CoA-carboxylase] ligase
MTMGRERQILQILNDGRFYSGEALAQQLEISRAAVWKAIRTLQDWGVDIQAVHGRGYRLTEPLELLERNRIVAELEDAVRGCLQGIEIHQHIDSTNSYLMAQTKFDLRSGLACLAESQSAGRGRRGRSWVSPFAANLYLSLLWRFAMGPSFLTGLSLACGVAVARALQGLGVKEIGLKWPNDLLWRGRKLGGILVEFVGESTGPCQVVAGVGLNMAMPRSAGNAIDQPWVDLRAILGSERISRNRLAARVLSEMVLIFSHFERHGLEGIGEQWRDFDLIAGKSVTLQLPHGAVTGIARGIDESGALCLLTPAGLERFLGGEISLRFAE